MILVVAPNPTIDVTYDVDGLRPGATNRVTAVRERVGGKPLNVARALRALGHEVTVVGFATDDLVAEGVWVRVPGRARRTVAVVDRTADSVTSLNEPGPAVDAEAWAELRAAVAERLPAAAALVLSGSLPPGLPRDAYATLVTMARAAGVYVSVDADGDALLLALPAAPNLVKPNRDELTSALGSIDPAAGAQRLRTAGAEAVVVSLGPEGLVAATPEGEWAVAPRRVVAGNPTGAGDATVAGLVGGAVTGEPWPDRLRRAVELGAAAVRRPMLWTLACDHRNSFRTQFLGLTGAPTAEDTALARRAKRLVFEALLRARELGLPGGEPAILVDEEYGADVIAAARAAGVTVVVPVEASGRDELAFEHGDHGFAAAVERVDPTYVKVLVRYHPGGDRVLNRRQEQRLATLQAWLDDVGRGWMLELLVPPLAADTAPGWDDAVRPGLTVEAIERLTAVGLHPAFWKLEGMPTTEAYAAVAAATQPGARCLVLGRGADREAVDRWLTLAAPLPGYGGFAVGRTLWWEPLRAALRGDLPDDEAVDAIAANYRRLAALYRDQG